MSLLNSEVPFDILKYIRIVKRIEYKFISSLCKLSKNVEIKLDELEWEKSILVYPFVSLIKEVNTIKFKSSLNKSKLPRALQVTVENISCTGGEGNLPLDEYPNLNKLYLRYYQIKDPLVLKQPLTLTSICLESESNEEYAIIKPTLQNSKNHLISFTLNSYDIY